MNDQIWQPSRLPIGEQFRPRVNAEIVAALAHPLVVVLAATGFGKTIAARSVWDRTEGTKAWWGVQAGTQDASDDIDNLTSAARCAWGLAKSSNHCITDFLLELKHAKSGLLVIDNLNIGQTPAIWNALAQLVPVLPPSCHVLLLCRDSPPLPLALWRSQNRVAMIYQPVLALDFSEWQLAGFGNDEAACQAALGWWGAEAAATALSANASLATTWNQHLAAWVDEVLLASLSAQGKYLLSVCSLLPELQFELVCAMAGVSPSSACNAWQEFPVCSGPIRASVNTLSIAERYRGYIMKAWQRSDPQAWEQAVDRGVDYLLEQGEFGDAAQLSHDSGLSAKQEAVLQAAGWTLLFGMHRSLLGLLLKESVGPASANTTLLRHAWQIEVEKLPHSVDTDLMKCTDKLEGDLLAAALALSASIGWQYDDIDRAEQQARAALDAFPNDRHPGYTLATLTLGNVLLIRGDLNLSEAMLKRANAYATRDDLPYLQLEILRRRALLASESGDYVTSGQLAQQAYEVAASFELQSEARIDAAVGLTAWINLQSLNVGALSLGLQLDDAATESMDERWRLPHRWFACVLKLLANDLPGAQQEVDWITFELSQRFVPYSWQNDATIIQLWFAARTVDQVRLRALTQQLAHCDWKASLHTDRRRVMLAAARLLAEIDDDQDALHALHVRLTEHGAHTLAHQLSLILAVRGDSNDSSALLAHVQLSAGRDQIFDYMWLGSKTVGPLERLLNAPEFANDSNSLIFLKKVLQHLHAPAPDTSDLTTERTPPADLTKKEWRVLQLIERGHTNEQIAAGLFITLATVKTHINHIYSKLNIKSRAEAVYIARSL